MPAHPPGRVGLIGDGPGHPFPDDRVGCQAIALLHRERSGLGEDLGEVRLPDIVQVRRLDQGREGLEVEAHRLAQETGGSGDARGMVRVVALDESHGGPLLGGRAALDTHPRHGERGKITGKQPRNPRVDTAAQPPLLDGEEEVDQIADGREEAEVADDPEQPLEQDTLPEVLRNFD
ncbi:hypothetical protein D3C87_1530000 [compost metagenome]